MWFIIYNATITHICSNTNVFELYYFNTFYSLRYLYIGLALVCAYIGYSLNDYLLLMVKIIIFFEYVNILTFTTSSSESVYAIEKFLNLFNIFYLDVTPAAFSINNMLRYNPLYNNVKINVMNASLSRGIVYNKLNIKNRIKLHSNVRRLTKIKSKQILEESKLRLFDIKKRRTNFRTNKLSGYDLFCILFHIVLLYCVLVSGGYLWDIKYVCHIMDHYFMAIKFKKMNLL